MESRFVTLSAQHGSRSGDIALLTRCRAELAAIASLSRVAAEYFSHLGALSTSGFGAYERTGVVKNLGSTPRMRAQLEIDRII